MPVSRESELLDQIENLEDGYESIKDIHKKELSDQIKEFLKGLDKINKIVVGGCPKVNVITEIFGMKKKWGKRLKE